jgi:hypothetical protein
MKKVTLGPEQVMHSNIAVKWNGKITLKHTLKTIKTVLLLLQIMLENPDKQWNKDELPRIYGKYAPEDLSRVVNTLNRLAVIMRSRRFGDGALRIDQPKLCFSLESGSGLPLTYSLYVNRESHR